MSYSTGVKANLRKGLYTFGVLVTNHWKAGPDEEEVSHEVAIEVSTGVDAGVVVVVSVQYHIGSCEGWKGEFYVRK